MKSTLLIILVYVVFSFKLKKNENPFIGKWELNSLVVNQDTLFLKGQPKFSYNHIESQFITTTEEKDEAATKTYELMSTFEMEFKDNKMISHGDAIGKNELKKKSLWSKYEFTNDTLIFNQNQNELPRMVNYSFKENGVILILKEEYVKTTWKKIN